MRALVLALAAALTAASLARAESMLVRGDDARTLGWPVYDAEGKLGFTTCDGRSEPLSEGGSFIATEERCPGAPAPFTLAGTVHAIAPERGRLEVREASGASRMLYLSPEAAAALAALPPGAAIRVEGPVAGHAATVAPAS